MFELPTIATVFDELSVGPANPSGIPNVATSNRNASNTPLPTICQIQNLVAALRWRATIEPMNPHKAKTKLATIKPNNSSLANRMQNSKIFR